MADALPVIIALIIHFVLRISLFLEPPPGGCSAAPAIASVMFLASTVIILLDTNIYPHKYKRVPVTCRIFVEFIISLIIIEFSMVFLWCRAEQIIQRMFRCILLDGDMNIYYDMGGDYLTGCLITLFSFEILLNVILATNYYEIAKGHGEIYYNKFHVEYLKFMDKICQFGNCCNNLQIQEQTTPIPLDSSETECTETDDISSFESNTETKRKVKREGCRSSVGCNRTFK